MLDLIKNVILPISQTIAAGFTVVGIYYAIRQYQLAKEKKRPFIFVDFESAVSGLIDLVIYNSGESPAENIKIEFNPNVSLDSHNGTKINDLKVLQNLKFLAPSKNLSFFLGSVIGGKTPICQEFKVNIKYRNQEGKKYSSDQTLDLRDLIELPHLDKKGIDDVARSLKGISESLSKVERTHSDLLSAVKNGFPIRGIELKDLSLRDLLILLKNIYELGNEEDRWLNPFIYDTKQIIQIARTKILAKKTITKKEREILEKLNFMLKYQPVVGENKFEKYLESLTRIL